MVLHMFSPSIENGLTYGFPHQSQSVIDSFKFEFKVLILVNLKLVLARATLKQVGIEPHRDLLIADEVVME